MADPLAEKVVQPAINPDHLAYCPTMDLMALATVDDHVRVYRLNGQQVFGVQSRDSSAKVGNIKWKPNGQSLATAFTNGTLFLTNARTGKVVRQVDCSKFSKSRICCLGWGISFTERMKVSEQIIKSKGEVTLDDVIARNPQVKVIEDVPDLPLDLAFLDVEASLPKLSPLSSGGIEDDIFSSRMSLDTLFQPLTAASIDSADILIVGFEDGTIHLSIYDFFEIGRFNLQQAARTLEDCRPLLHSCHPYSTTHSLLISNSIAGTDEVNLVPLDLRLLSSAGRYLSLLASKSTQLHNVLRYIHQVQKQLYSDFKASQELPKRFMANIEETLEENCDCNWTQAAYHLAVTGHCHPEVKDWLVDQLGERGHKRWEKAISTGYESVRGLAHENLLPALERFTVILSRLRGLSRFQVSNASLGLSTQELDTILDTVSCLQLVAHRILIAAVSEFRQFQAFSGWLRQEIDIQATVTSSSETMDRDTSVDHTSTLGYIQGAMTKSHLVNLFNLMEKGESPVQWDLATEKRSLMDLYKREYRSVLDDESTSKQLPGLDVLIDHLDNQCETVFHRIAQTQQRNVRFGTPISLGAGVPSCMDMRAVVEEPIHKGNHITYVALGPRANQANVHIYRISIETVSGMSSTKQLEHATIQTAGWEINDLKFIDDEELVLAVSGQGLSRLLRLRYRKMADHPQGLIYTESDCDGTGARKTEEDRHRPGIDFSDADQCSACTWQAFPTGVSWVPIKIEVNGRKGRRVLCVIAHDRLHYRIYDLDSSSSTEEDGDAATEGVDDIMS